jgi:hypothetical protein
MGSVEEVKNVFNRQRNALLNNDLVLLKEIYPPDYEGYNILGGIEKRDLIFQFYKPGGVKLDRFDAENLNVEVFGNVGIVSGVGIIHGRYLDQEFGHRIRFIDIYLFRKDKWQCYRSQSTEIV